MCTPDYLLQEAAARAQAEARMAELVGVRRSTYPLDESTLPTRPEHERAAWHGAKAPA